MDLLKQLKNLLKIPGNRVIIVEEGKPAFVMTTIEDYLKLVSGKAMPEKQKPNARPDWTADQEEQSDFKEWMADVNKVLAEVSEKETPEEPELEQDDDEELKIEDLPF